MNSNGLVRFSPGELPLQRLCGQVKVLLFIVFTVLIIATFDFRILLAVTVISAAALVSLKPNWKLVGALISIPSVQKKMKGQMNQYIIGPYQKVVENAAKTEVH